MNIKAIIASLVLGSSSVAMADPGVTFSASAHGEYDAPILTRDHRRDVFRDDDHRDHDHGDAPCDHPSSPVYEPPQRRIGWSGGGWDPGRRQPPYYRPVTLASGLHFAGDGRTFITVGRDAGRFTTLQIHAAGGRTFIKQVYIQFENGQEQVVRNLDRTLTGYEGLRLDLDGDRRAIRRIVVYGSEINRGWRRSPGAFTVTAA
jgi:hypothetical protein